ncbi:MAG: hypothetical protein WD232_04905, partial [Acidimicrobiales bacterium]
MSETSASTSFGPNAWLVDEMHEQYLEDPSSVSESWQEFFADAPASKAPETKAPETKAPAAKAA